MAAKRPTIADVAHAAGVTKGTASKALASIVGKYPVSLATREKVMAAARTLGFTLVDQAGKRHGRIALLFANEAPNLDGINLGLHVALVDHLRQRQLEVVYQSMDRGSRDARRRALAKVDGCLLVSRTPVIAEEWRMWLDELAGLAPAIAINAGTRLSIPQVEPDDAMGARQLLLDLVQQGHRRLAVVGRRHQPTMQHGSHHLRHATLLTEAQVATCTLVDWTDVGDEVVTRRLQTAGVDAPTAIIGLSGWHFPALWSAWHRLGIAMPPHVALATCDDPPFNRQMTPALTGVTWSMNTLVERALATLDLVLSGSTPPAMTLVPQRVVHRASTLAWRRSL